VEARFDYHDRIHNFQASIGPRPDDTIGLRPRLSSTAPTRVNAPSGAADQRAARSLTAC
jgi:hypothetical protein